MGTYLNIVHCHSHKALSLGNQQNRSMTEPNPNIERAKRYLQESLGAEDGKKDISCRWFLDRAFLCVTPGNQMLHYYRYGRADECGATWRSMMQCLRASLMDEDKRMEYLKTTPLDPTTPPHTTDVWETKENPGW